MARTTVAVKVSNKKVKGQPESPPSRPTNRSPELATAGRSMRKEISRSQLGAWLAPGRRKWTHRDENTSGLGARGSFASAEGHAHPSS